MPHRGKRDLHIDPPASSNAIMQRARAPPAERTVNPAGTSTESSGELDIQPRVREQPQPLPDIMTLARLCAGLHHPPIALRSGPRAQRSRSRALSEPLAVDAAHAPTNYKSIQNGRRHLVFEKQSRPTLHPTRHQPCCYTYRFPVEAIPELHLA